MLRCQLCSAHYTALQIKNCLKITSAIKVVTMKNMDDFRYKGKPSCTTAKSTPFAISKDEWDAQRRTPVNALYILWYANRHMSG